VVRREVWGRVARVSCDHATQNPTITFIPNPRAERRNHVYIHSRLEVYHIRMHRIQPSGPLLEEVTASCLSIKHKYPTRIIPTHYFLLKKYHHSGNNSLSVVHCWCCNSTQPTPSSTYSKSSPSIYSPPL